MIDQVLLHTNMQKLLKFQNNHDSDSDELSGRSQFERPQNAAFEYAPSEFGQLWSCSYEAGLIISSSSQIPETFVALCLQSLLSHHIYFLQHILHHT